MKRPQSLAKFTGSVSSIVLALFVSQSAFAAQTELWCESGDPSGVGPTATVMFDDQRALTGIQIPVSIDWRKDTGQKAQFGGLAAEKKVRWNGIWIKSLSFSISKTISFEVLYSFTDDLFAVRKLVLAPGGKSFTVESELTCQL